MKTQGSVLFWRPTVMMTKGQQTFKFCLNNDSIGLMMFLLRDSKVWWRCVWKLLHFSYTHTVEELYFLNFLIWNWDLRPKMNIFRFRYNPVLSFYDINGGIWALQTYFVTAGLRCLVFLTWEKTRSSEPRCDPVHGSWALCWVLNLVR